MVVDVCNGIYGIEFRKYGRWGQKQYGIDIFEDSIKHERAVQCKNYKLNVAELDKIIHCITVNFQIGEFIVATSGNTDARLHNRVILFNQSQNYPFKITLLFWDDIENVIVENKLLLQKYYKNPSSAFENNGYSVGNMTDEFNCILSEHHDVEFLKGDPIAGFSYELCVDIDVFLGIMDKLLNKFLIFQKTETYNAIAKFRYKMDELAEYLSKKLYLSNNREFVLYLPLVSRKH